MKNSDYEKLTSKTLIICFSSGETSALMTKTILENLECKPAIRNGVLCHLSKHNRYVFVVFNNTGREDDESLIFAKRCDDEFGFRTVWLQAKINHQKGKGPTAQILNFETVDRDGIVFEEFIKKHGLPQPGKRKCTEVLKMQNTQSFIRQQGIKDYFLSVGIRIDEPNRHKWEKAKREKVIWPLTTIWPTTKFEVNYFFTRNSFRLNIEAPWGNCTDCHLKALWKLVLVAKKTPEKVQWSLRVGKEYENHIPAGHNKNGTIKVPIKMYRDYMSMDDIIELANSDEFKNIIDPAKLSEYYRQNEECGESCEAF